MFLSESLRARVRLRGNTGHAFFALLLAALFAPAAALAQVGVDSTGTGGNHVIQGRILFPSGRRADSRLRVRLQTQSSGELSVYTDANGYFGFRSLEAGSYTVVIEGGNDYETVRESIYIETDVNRMIRGAPAAPSPSRPYTMQVYLQPKRKPGMTAEERPGTLNASLAAIPKPAVELYNKALEVLRSSEQPKPADLLKAVELLKAAVAAHSDFPLALAEMGMLYMKLKEPAKAVEPLREANRLTPDDYPTLFTYAVALHDSQQYADAEAQFRKAARKNATAPLPHYYLGIILIRRKELDEAERELKTAVEVGGDQVPYAHKYLGGILWQKGDHKRAAVELETYLKLVPDAPDAQRLRATVKEFRSKK